MAEEGAAEEGPGESAEEPAVNLTFEQEKVFKSWRRTLLRTRKEVLADLASMPEVASLKRKAWMHRHVSQIEAMLDGKHSVTAGGRVVTTVRGLPDDLWDDFPAARLYRARAGEAVEQFGLRFPMLNQRAVAWAEQYKFGYLDQLTAYTKSQVTSAIRTGVLRGESVDKIARRLKGTRLARGTYDNVLQRARVIARTEIAEIVKQGRKAGYLEVGVERVRIIGQGTDCPICGGFIGNEYDIDSAPLPPYHPNCRCDFVAVVRRGLRLK